MKFLTILSTLAVLSIASPVPNAEPIAYGEVEARGTLEARGTPSSYVCGGRWALCETKNIGLAINTFGGAGGRGDLICNDPHTCKQLARTVDAIFGFCNDNDYGKCVTRNDLTNRGSDVIRLCFNSGSAQKGSGQAFYGDGTNVILHHAQ